MSAQARTLPRSRPPPEESGTVLRVACERGRGFIRSRSSALPGQLTEFLGLLSEPPPAVAAVFRRVLADTLKEMSTVTDDIPSLAHLQAGPQALRNVRPFVDRPSIQQAIDVGLNAAANMQEQARTSPGCCCRSSDKLKTRCGPTQETGPTLTGWRRGAVNIITTVLKPRRLVAEQPEQVSTRRQPFWLDPIGAAASVHDLYLRCGAEARHCPRDLDPGRGRLGSLRRSARSVFLPTVPTARAAIYRRCRSAKWTPRRPPMSTTNGAAVPLVGLKPGSTRLKGTQMLCRKPQESAKKPESFVGRRLSKLP